MILNCSLRYFHFGWGGYTAASRGKVSHTFLVVRERRRNWRWTRLYRCYLVNPDGVMFNGIVIYNAIHLGPLRVELTRRYLITEEA